MPINPEKDQVKIDVLNDPAGRTTPEADRRTCRPTGAARPSGPLALGRSASPVLMVPGRSDRYTGPFTDGGLWITQGVGCEKF